MDFLPRPNHQYLPFYYLKREKEDWKCPEHMGRDCVKTCKRFISCMNKLKYTLLLLFVSSHFFQLYFFSVFRFWLVFFRTKNIHYQHFRNGSEMSATLFYNLFIYYSGKFHARNGKRIHHILVVLLFHCYNMICHCRILCMNEFFVFQPIISTYFAALHSIPKTSSCVKHECLLNASSPTIR